MINEMFKIVLLEKFVNLLLLSYWIADLHGFIEVSILEKPI